MKVNAGIAADRDFKLDIQTNAGNDLVNFSFENLTGSRLLNQIALNNVSIDLGAGNDEVWFWGNGAVKVNDGAGDDKVYVGRTPTTRMRSSCSAPTMRPKPSSRPVPTARSPCRTKSWPPMPRALKSPLPLPAP